MPDLRLTRDFNVTPERLFNAITRRADLLRWWGPEGMDLPEEHLDFSRTGPWFSVMRNSEGQRYKVSGQVTHVTPPRSVGFTWAWHDDSDTRGAESHVTFTIEKTDTGARLVIDHRDLGDDEASASHERGWTSTLNKLTNLLS
ncbi:SRPBCC domain-containing protein [Shimia sp. CNT1-13L.2]|uniref:SRPBCC family protein n=1 Tax=Shimia sp. CNT1-13L.2 TaxID=2959663 RepID=UPI0020CFE675|nr:SRPBCC domain-containing protein [Shimia sp. CNT1-13L.2]MCP9481031.1 SRPBCC domain-containing protein [Shimia sp. CNT1-13L.2]